MADFSAALAHMKAGGAVARPSWQEHGFRMLFLPGMRFAGAGGQLEGEYTTGPYFGIVNPNNVIAVWSAAIGDIIAEDWILLEASKEDPLA